GVEDAQRERCLDVAELIAARVPLCRRLGLLVDAKALSVEAAEQCVRLRIVALDALLGELERSEILALIEGDIGRFVARWRHQRFGVGTLPGRRRTLECGCLVGA